MGGMAWNQRLIAVLCLAPDSWSLQAPASAFTKRLAHGDMIADEEFEAEARTWGSPAVVGDSNSLAAVAGWRRLAPAVEFLLVPHAPAAFGESADVWCRKVLQMLCATAGARRAVLPLDEARASLPSLPEPWKTDGPEHPLTRHVYQRLAALSGLAPADAEPELKSLLTLLRGQHRLATSQTTESAGPPMRPLGRLVARRPKPAPEAASAPLLPPKEPGLFERWFSSVSRDFDEDAYLFANPDVADAVRRGVFSSGWSHWQIQGQREVRGGGLRPAPIERWPIRKPFGVNLYGFLSSASGMATGARANQTALAAAGIPTMPVDIPQWPVAGNDPRVTKVIASEPQFRLNLLHQNPDMLPLFRGTYGDAKLAGCYNIGYWAWELPAIRPDWHHLYQYVDEVWTPSRFCRDAFQCLTNHTVVTIPHVVDGLESKAVHDRGYFDLPPGKFVFGYFFDVSSYLDRKNPFCLIDAFRREFADNSSVLLYLKLSRADADPLNVERIVEAADGAANIRVVTQPMSETEVISLHNAIDCFVSPHRSEGFGLNLAESMYFGKPVIATRYSGNLDFMDDANGLLIDCALIPIRRTIGPYREHNVWAEPSAEHLRQLMREAVENRSAREGKGARAAETIRERLSAATVGGRIAARLREAGLEDSGAIRLPAPVPTPQKMMLDSVPQAVAAEIRAMPEKPLISVVTPVYNIAPALLRKCIESVRAQIYPFWELCLCDDGSTNLGTIETLEACRGVDPRIKIVFSEQNLGIAGASNRAAEIACGSYIALLDNDDEIAPDALLEVARAINRDPGVDFLYTDEDKIESDGRHSDHYCKPDWSPEHLRSVMYVLHMMVFRKRLFYEVGGFRDAYSGAQDYDLALRLSEKAQRIHHIPKILYHWRKIPGSAAAEVNAKPAALLAARRALEDHVRRVGLDASVEPGKLEGFFRVRHRIATKPLVSLCITTDDRPATVEGRGTFNLVSNFVRSIAERTEYSNYEIVLVDNGNLSDASRKAMAGISYRLESYRGPMRPFNFAHKANFSFSQTRGEHVVLLNDDMEVISPGWLDALIEFSQQPEIGAVGARLLFPSERVQHCGVVIGVNNGAAHVYHNYPASFIGYNGYTHAIRNYAAVTGACLATRRSVIEELGGFDESLAIDYNDIDYCLAALDRGYRIVYTPFAELYHFEGVTVKRREQNPDEVRLFSERWAKYMERDPFYNPNLTRNGVDFSLA